MASTLSRRSLVAVAAPVAMLACSSASAAARPDAALLALQPLWREADAAFEATFDPLRVAEEGVRARLKAEPHLSRSLVERESGYTLALENQSRASNTEWRIADRVFATPATTSDGIRFKLEVLRVLKGCDVSSFEASLKRNLLRMVGIYDA